MGISDTFGGIDMKLFGFIGIGNMGGAIAASAAKAFDTSEILVSAAHAKTQ